MFVYMSKHYSNWWSSGLSGWSKVLFRIRPLEERQLVSRLKVAVMYALQSQTYWTIGIQGFSFTKQCFEARGHQKWFKLKESNY